MNSHLSGNVFEKNVLAMHKFCVITNMLLFFGKGNKNHAHRKIKACFLLFFNNYYIK